MIRKLLTKAKYLTIFAFIVLIFPQLSTMGSETVEAQTKPQPYQQTATVEAKQLDSRAQILRNYLESKGSPLANYSQDFIDAADQNGVDWKLVPAISGVESTFGQALPTGSYNAWGVGGSNLVYFKSWNNSIYFLNSYLKQNYINRGLTNPYAINRVYAASPTWGSRVSFFMADLDQYAKKSDQKLKGNRLSDVLSLTTLSPKPAPLPAVIAFK